MRAFLCVLVVLAVGALPASAQDYAPERAAALDLRSLCAQDRGRLWGADLCGPLIVVNPENRSIWATEQDRQGLLQRHGEGWVGALPIGVTMANTTVDWAGVRWIMVLGPLPADEVQRRVLVGHEAWHRVQAELGLAWQAYDGSHLETERGRTLMRLEMRALSTAMRSRGAARRRAAQDALTLRRTRLTEFPAAGAQEASLDRNEGLASYTGVRLGAGNGADMFAARTLDQYDNHTALARSYAYATGPAYGLLLDEYRRTWRQELGAFAPADLLSTAIRAQLVDSQELRRIEARYGGDAIAAEERARVQTQRLRIADLRRRFVDGPRLELPLAQMQMDFDPNQVTPIEGAGSFYGRITLRDLWGEMTAPEGAMINQTFTRMTAPTPSSDGVSGPGWRLSLAQGWRTVPADSAGVVRVEPIPPETE